MLSKGILPVLVVVENKSTDATFYLQKSLASLGSSIVSSPKMPSNIPTAEGNAEIAGAGLTVAETESFFTKESSAYAIAVTATLAAQAVGGFALMGAGLMAATKLPTDAEIIRQNLIKNELQEGIVSPGQSQYGFLYFKLPDDFAIETVSAIQLKAKNLQTQEMLQFIFPIK